jgi:hypothetical protein
MHDPAAVRQIQRRYRSLLPLMDARLRRQWAASEAQAYGWGGVSAVSEAIGRSPHTMRRGIEALQARARHPNAPVESRVRRPGGGRTRVSEIEKELVDSLERLVDPTTRGDPDSPLRWTCTSTTQLAEALTRQGHPLSPRSVGRLLNEVGYSLQSNRKTLEGASHPDRNAQFENISRTVLAFQNEGQPVISVDTKKKELVGAFKNGGREWRPRGEPEEVKIYDFLEPERGNASPYGVYDLTSNQGWVRVGIDHDTARVAVDATRRWWQQMGAKRDRSAHRLLITADGGGRHGSRCRLWNVALQNLATPLGRPIHVSHFPPGTSTWNKIAHRLFSHLTQNWRGRPLVSHAVSINLMANTVTKTGLKIRAEIDRGSYPTGVVVADQDLAAVNLKRATFHGDWNYAILPTRRTK